MLKIKLLDKRCKPYRAHKTDSGLDLRTNTDVTLRPLCTQTVSTGIAIELPEGYEAQIRPRSGLSKQGILTALGTIDNGYRGEIKVTLTNASSSRVTLNKHDRIAQLIIAPITIPKVQYVKKLSETDRGNKGHGSTGRT